VDPAPAPQSICDVLLVEDSFDDVFFVKRAWQTHGEPYQLVHVTDGDKARAYLLGEDEFVTRAELPLPRLVVSDLKMPRWDGMQLLRWMRSQPQFSHLPFVMLSSSPQESDISNAYAAGANAYFVKPRTLTGFMQLLAELQHFWNSDQVKTKR